MPKTNPKPEVLAVLLCHDERALLREHFAREEGLTPELARRHYSDNILQAALTADPELYEQWRIAAYEAMFHR